jgi:hypothetical protein
MYPQCILEPRQIHVSHMYPACIPHVSHVHDTYILMYLICIPKCILDSFGIRVKYIHAKIKIHVFSWNVTRPDFFSLGICSSSLRDGPSTIVPTYTPLMREHPRRRYAPVGILVNTPLPGIPSLVALFVKPRRVRTIGWG